MDNALRFTPEQGTITISVAPHPGLTEIVVQDTGSGIAAEHLRHVFDRFYRADRARSSEGSGLGLALVKSIAELHGGSVVLTSEIDRGTRVAVRFPDRAATRE